MSCLVIMHIKRRQSCCLKRSLFLETASENTHNSGLGGLPVGIGPSPIPNPIPDCEKCFMKNIITIVVVVMWLNSSLSESELDFIDILKDVDSCLKDSKQLQLPLFAVVNY